MENIKFFDKWDVKDIEIKDISLEKYINLNPTLTCHTHGRHEHKKFRKSNLNIVERFVNRLMTPGLSKRKIGGRQPKSLSGKKLKTINIVKNSFVIINLRTRKNPIEILVRAIENSAPREETTRLSYGGIVYQQAVDIAPQRRVDLALKYLVESCFRKSFNNPLTIEEIIAEELILTANGDTKSHAIKRKEERERLAQSAR
ncbi:MAG: 30S ribosomal protein S7 [Candidatus Helarchaeota archaeon]